MNEMFATNFGAIDWVIVAIYLTGVAAVGMLVNRYIHNASDYIVGGRGSGTALNVAAYIGTGLGLVTIMYSAMDGFTMGFTYLMIGLINLAVGLFIGTSGFVVHRLRTHILMTIPEFYEHRFDRKTRVAAGSICAAAGILNMGLFPKMGATFITYTTGMGSGEGEMLVNLVTSLMIVLVLIYTVMGGMVSVIVTDYIQFIILSLGLLIGLLYCFFSPELGWSRMVDTLAVNRGEKAFNPFHPDSYGWLYMLWMCLVNLAAGVCWGPEASRSLTTKDAETSRRTFLFASPGLFISRGIPAVWAIGAFCYIANHPDLSAYFFPEGPSGTIQNAVQATPLFIGKIVPSILLGILVSGAMAAFMSTHSGYLLCWSTVIVRDVISPLRRVPLSDRQQIAITRVLLVLIASFLLIWGIWYKLPESVWTYMAVTGNVYLSGSATVLVGGMYWKRASKTGAFAGIVSGLFSVFGLREGVEWLQQFAPWMRAEMIGIGNYMLCIVVFIVVSLLFPDRDQPNAKEAAGR